MFDYVVYKSDLKALKEAMKKANDITPKDIEITFQHLDRRGRYFCRIYKYNEQYFIGGWRLPQKILYFPLNGLTV